MLREFLRRDLGLRAVRHEVVPLVAQHADEFGGERLVEQHEKLRHVGAIARGHRACVDVAARALAQRLDVGQGACAIGAINVRHVVLLGTNNEPAAFRRRGRRPPAMRRAATSCAPRRRRRIHSAASANAHFAPVRQRAHHDARTLLAAFDRALRRRPNPPRCRPAFPRSAAARARAAPATIPRLAPATGRAESAIDRLDVAPKLHEARPEKRRRARSSSRERSTSRRPPSATKHTGSAIATGQR